jgi:hypothetical protein
VFPVFFALRNLLPEPLYLQIFFFKSGEPSYNLLLASDHVILPSGFGVVRTEKNHGRAKTGSVPPQSRCLRTMYVEGSAGSSEVPS